MAAVPTRGSNALQYGNAVPKRRPDTLEQWERRQRELERRELLRRKKEAARGNRFGNGTASWRCKNCH